MSPKLSIRSRPTAAIAAVGLAVLIGSSIVGGGPAIASLADDPPGPGLTAEPELLDAALSCSGSMRRGKNPVLLVPGAGGDPVSVSAGLGPVLESSRFPTCLLTLPDGAFADFQDQAEYVVASVRKVAARSRRSVSIIGVSSGGPAVRWAIKWWPDLRSLTDDVIGIAPSNHGFDLATPLCGGPCPPATRQLKADSGFLSTLNSDDETPGRLPYSVISSADDGTVSPPSPDLEGDRDDSNTQVQSVCAGRSLDHAHIPFDAVAIALVRDALRHEGPARVRRIAGGVCRRTYPIGVDPSEIEAQIAAGAANAGAKYASAGLFTDEQPLSGYVDRGVPEPHAVLRIRPHRIKADRRTRVSITASGAMRNQSWPLPGAAIMIAGREVTTDPNGRASVQVEVRRKEGLTVRLLAQGLAPTSSRLHVR